MMISFPDCVLVQDPKRDCEYAFALLRLVSLDEMRTIGAVLSVARSDDAERDRGESVTPDMLQSYANVWALSAERAQQRLLGRPLTRCRAPKHG